MPSVLKIFSELLEHRARGKFTADAREFPPPTADIPCTPKSRSRARAPATSAWIHARSIRFKDALHSVLVEAPLLVCAFLTAAIAGATADQSWQSMAMSVPARSVCTAASPGPYRLAIAPMPRSSARITPSNRMRRRKTPSSIVRESEAGFSGSICGSRMCAVITSGTPAATAAAKGTSSADSSRSIVPAKTGKSRCGSTAASPCPGKCLAQESTPPDAQSAIKRGAHPGHEMRIRRQSCDPLSQDFLD